MKKVITETLDDIDGTPGAETHTIAVDGLTVHIDLCEANRKLLYEALRPYLDAGQRQPASTRSRAPKTIGGATRSAIRIWWKYNPNGLPPWRSSGAIPAAVQEAWQTQGRA